MPATVRVVNISRGAELASHASLADGFLARLRGLLGRERLHPGEGLVIVPCSSVHMWGMRFPLDVIHLDRHGTVLRLLPNLQPGQLGPYIWRSHTAVELPAGSIAASGTQAGDIVTLERSA
jgi:uncharacterized protein